MKKKLTIQRTDDGRIDYIIWTDGYITESKTLSRKASRDIERYMREMDGGNKDCTREMSRFIRTIALFVNGATDQRKGR